jgi:hypothetical protein
MGCARCTKGIGRDGKHSLIQFHLATLKGIANTLPIGKQVALTLTALKGKELSATAVAVGVAADVM